MAEQAELRAAQEAFDEALGGYEHNKENNRRSVEIDADYVVAAAEILTAAQQQRIEELVAALEPFARRWEWDNMDIAGDDPDPMYQGVGDTSELLPGMPIISRAEFRAAHAALCADVVEGE